MAVQISEQSHDWYIAVVQLHILHLYVGRKQIQQYHKMQLKHPRSEWDNKGKHINAICATELQQYINHVIVLKFVFLSKSLWKQQHQRA
jgi:hypothetical protein